MRKFITLNIGVIIWGFKKTKYLIKIWIQEHFWKNRVSGFVKGQFCDDSAPLKVE